MSSPRLQRAEADFGKMQTAAVGFGSIAVEFGRLIRYESTLIAEAGFGK